MGDGPDRDDGCLLRIDDGKRKSPKQESACVVLAYRPALRGLTNCVGGSMQFFDEIQGRFAAAFPILGDRAFNIRDCALVVFNSLNVHSPSPAVRDAVVPKRRSRLSPSSGPRFDAPLPGPK